MTFRRWSLPSKATRNPQRPPHFPNPLHTPKFHNGMGWANIRRVIKFKLRIRNSPLGMWLSNKFTKSFDSLMRNEFEIVGPNYNFVGNVSHSVLLVRSMRCRVAISIISNQRRNLNIFPIDRKKNESFACFPNWLCLLRSQPVTRPDASKLIKILSRSTKIFAQLSHATGRFFLAKISFSDEIITCNIWFHF